MATAVLAETSDKNLYNYCDNNPIIRKDEEGAFWNIASGIVIGGAISAGTEAILQVIEYKKAGKALDWKEIGKSAAVAGLTGAISGGCLAAGVPPATQKIVDFATSGLAEAYNQSKEDNSMAEKVFNVATSAALNAVWADDDLGVLRKQSVANRKHNEFVRAKLKAKKHKTVKVGAKILRKNLSKRKSVKKKMLTTGVKSTLRGTAKNIGLGYGRKNMWWTIKNW